MAVLALMLAGFGIYAWRSTQPIIVQVVGVERGDIQAGPDEDGLVRSETEAIVAARISGRLKSIDVRDGMSVTAGQTVARLDETETRAAIDAADADVSRNQALLNDTSVSVRTSVEAADADVAAASANVDAAKARRDEVERGPRSDERARALAIRSQAQSALWEAQRQFERQQKLFKMGYVPQRELDAAQSALRQSEARERQMQAEWRLVDEGSRTEEKRSANAQLSQFEAALANARAHLEKARAATPQIEAAKGALNAAEARARQARAQLHDILLTAPAAGTVTVQDDVSVGDVVAPGTVVARIVDPKRVWVEMQIDERDIAGVHPGMQVRINSDTWPDLTFNGRIARVEGEAVLKRRGVTSAGREEDRIFKARVDVDDTRNKLRPGMSVYAQIVTQTVKDALIIPREAAMPQGALWVAWVVDGGHAVKHNISLGVRDMRRVQVTSGLKADDRVIISGRELLQNGSRVRVADEPLATP